MNSLKGMHMPVTAVFANKGGVGKTLITANLAFSLSEAGRKVLVIDADTQCNLSLLCLGPNFLNVAKTTVETIMRPVYRGQGYVEEIETVRSDAFEIDVLSGDPAFALAEDFLGGEWIAARSGQLRGIGATLALRHAVQMLAPRYDDILIDCSPMLGSTTRAALLAADSFITPVTPSPFSVMGLGNAAQWVAKWRRSWAGIPIEGRREADLTSVPLPAFAGYVLNNSVYPTLVADAVPMRLIDEAAGKLDEACGQPIGAGSRIAELPYSGAARLAEVKRLPFRKLDSEHGVAGAAFADRFRAASAFDALANGYVARLGGPATADLKEPCA